MGSVLQPLANATGLAPVELALLLGLLLGAIVGWTLRGTRATGDGGPIARVPAPPAPVAFPPRGVVTTSISVLGEDGSREVDALIGGGRTIDAIKRVRELTGLGLKEAKEFVEALQRARG